MVERTPRRWTEFISLRMSRKDPAFRRYDKFEVAAIARELGVRSPAILRVFDKPAEFDDAGLPDAFVLKPVAMTGKRGVMVLQRLPDRSGYFDLLGRRQLGKAEIVAEQLLLRQRAEGLLGRRTGAAPTASSRRKSSSARMALIRFPSTTRLTLSTAW